MRPFRHATLVLVVLLAFGGPAAGLAEAQTPTARLRGSVTDASTALPLQGVRVVVGATGRFVQTDSTGRFEIDQLPSGILRFFFNRTGFPTASVVLAFAAGEVMTQAFEMDSSAATIAADTGRAGPRPQMLPTEEVRETASRGVRYLDFERRMRSGRGQYVTREQIEANNYSALTDAVRGMRGVSVDCSSGRNCSIRMARAPMRCAPKYYVDGREDDMFGPYVAIGDIEGMEVYTGPSDVPGEYAGSEAMCGVVVIWTKSAPAPPRRP